MYDDGEMRIYQKDDRDLDAQINKDWLKIGGLALLAPIGLMSSLLRRARYELRLRRMKELKQSKKKKTNNSPDQFYT